MKKSIGLFLIGALLVSGLSPVMAYAEDNSIQVVLNGSPISFPDAKPFIDNQTGRTMVPLRFISEQMGANVIWDASAQTVHASLPNITIDLPIGKTNVRVNGEDHQVDAPAVIVDGRTMVPLRFISENLSAKVTWDNYTDTVNIVTNGKIAKEQAFQDTMTQVIQNNINHLQTKDLEAYMNDLDGTPDDMIQTRSLTQAIIDKYDLTYDISDVKVLAHDMSDALVEVTQTTRCTNNDGSFRNNKMVAVHELKLEASTWKFVKTTVASIQYLKSE